jgi:hypothetical protein
MLALAIYSAPGIAILAWSVADKIRFNLRKSA